MSLSFSELAFHRGGRQVVGPLTGEIAPGELVGVVGPNGSGKSTLLRLLYGYLRPQQGSISLDDQELSEFEPRALAQCMGACPQEAEPSLDFFVEQALALSGEGNPTLTAERCARYPFLGLEELYGRHLSELSGGEKQRVRLGRALLPGPAWLVLDEPANHLDLRTSWSVMSYLRRSRPGGVVVAMHDLPFALRFCHRLMLLKAGRMIAFDTPEKTLSRANLAEVFGLDAEVHRQEHGWNLEVRGVSQP